VDRSALWLALKTVGTPGILLQLLKDILISSGARIMVGGECLRQILHNLGRAPGSAVDWILDNMTCLRGFTVGSGRFTDLDFADDIV